MGRFTFLEFRIGGLSVQISVKSLRRTSSKIIALRRMTFFVGTFSPGGPQKVLRAKINEKYAKSLFSRACNFVGSDYSTPLMGVRWNHMVHENKFHIGDEV